MNEKCHGCIYYDPCWLKCRLGRNEKDCTFWTLIKLRLSSLYGKQVRKKINKLVCIEAEGET